MALSLRQPTLAKASVGKPRSRVASKVVCSAQKQDTLKQVSTAFAAAALAATVGLTSADAAYADIAGLTPCSESKAYAKRLKKELKDLDKRAKLYQADSAPALALAATKERTQKRFDNYAKAGLLCGNDGLPHLIADPGFALKYGHAGEIFIPTFGFLYVAGYIGYVGRQYLQIVKAGGKATDKEIIIDVPLALQLAWQGGAWPLATISELRNGTLTEKEENITVSPR